MKGVKGGREKTETGQEQAKEHEELKIRSHRDERRKESLEEDEVGERECKNFKGVGYDER